MSNTLRDLIIVVICFVGLTLTILPLRHTKEEVGAPKDNTIYLQAKDYPRTLNQGSPAPELCMQIPTEYREARDACLNDPPYR